MSFARPGVERFDHPPRAGVERFGYRPVRERFDRLPRVGVERFDASITARGPVRGRLTRVNGRSWRGVGWRTRTPGRRRKLRASRDKRPRPRAVPARACLTPPVRPLRHHAGAEITGQGLRAPRGDLLHRRFLHMAIATDLLPGTGQGTQVAAD